MRHNITLKFSTFFITIVLVIILISQISIKDVTATFRSIDALYLILGFLLYAISILFKSLRFYLLLNKEVRMQELYKVVCAHNMMNNLLPARTGEISYIYFLNKTQGRNTGEGVATLIIARFLDFVVIGGIFLCAFEITQHLPETAFQTAIVAFIVMMVSILFINFLLKLDRERIIKKIDQFFRITKVDNTQIAGFIIRKTHETIDSFETLSHQDKRFHLKCLLTTLGIWGSVYLFFICITFAMHIEEGFIPLIFACSFAIFTTVLPIQGVAGFGTFEGGWVIGFMLIGVSETLAISSGFAFHLIWLLFTIIFGLWGYIFLKFNKDLRNIV